MAERIRLFVGTTELKYSSATITRTNDHIIDTAGISIEGDANVTNSSSIDFKKKDGSTSIISAKVEELKRPNVWTITAFTNGYELNNIKVEQVYTNTSPEAIVQDVIDTWMPNLTFVSGTSSGITIGKYVANAYGIDVVKDMIDVLKWQLVIDTNDQVTFEPPGNTDNGKIFTNGTNISIKSWDEDKHPVLNKVKVIGGFESFSTTQTTASSGTEFTLDKKPSGTMVVTVSGVEVDPADYVVDAEEKTVTFDSSQTNPVFSHSWSRPVIVEDLDDDSITDHGERYKEVQAPWLNSISDARRYASKLVSALSTPPAKVKGVEPELNFTQQPGELVRVVDPVRGRSGTFVIIKMVLDASANSTTYTFGSRDELFYDWQREVQERVKKLERRLINAEEVAFARTFKHDANVTLTNTQRLKCKSPIDSFHLDHNTLSRLRVDKNREVDCSDNSHSGTWSGSGIDGAQYVKSGYRLSSGKFNGSDRIITVSDHSDLDLSGDFTIAFAVKVDTLPGAEIYILNKWDGTDGYAVRINSSNQLELIYSNSGSDSTITASTALTAKTFQHVSFVKDGTALTVYVDGSSDNTATGDAAAGTNSEDLVIGNYSSSFFNGELDELRVYDDNLSASNVSNIYNKIHVSSNLKCYLSMDNPTLGDKSTPKVICLSNTSFQLDLSSSDNDSNSTGYWDTANERWVMDSSDNHLITYNVNFKTKQSYFTGKSFATATLTATEVVWGNDVIMWFLSNDGGDDGGNWHEVSNGSEFTFPVLGNDLRVMAVLIGNGASSTYAEDIQVSVTRS